MSSDYNLILEVDEYSTSDEIAASFKRLVKLYHPDINKEPDATEKMREVIEAYQWLKDNHVQRFEEHQRQTQQKNNRVFQFMWKNVKTKQTAVTDVFRWLSYPQPMHTVLISQTIIDAGDVVCHCMYNLDEFAFRIPKGTKLPSVATVKLSFGEMKITIRDELTINPAARMNVKRKS